MNNSIHHHLILVDLPPMRHLLLDTINPRGDLSIIPTFVISQVVLLLVALSPFPYPNEIQANAILIIIRLV